MGIFCRSTLSEDLPCQLIDDALMAFVSVGYPPARLLGTKESLAFASWSSGSS